MGCEDFTIKGGLNFVGPLVKKNTLVLTTGHQPDCGFQMDGEVEFGGCEDFTITGGLNFVGPLVKKNTLVLTAGHQPDCGFQMSGEVEFGGCEDFTITGALNFVGPLVKKNTLVLTAGTQPDCGFQMSGEVEFQACNSLEVKPITGGLITLSGPEGILLTTIDLNPVLTITTKADDECTKEVELAFDDTELYFALVREDEKFISLYVNSSNAGKVECASGCCLFNCSGADGGTTEILIDMLKVRLIRPVDPECCEAECKPSYIDMCKSEILLQKAWHDIIKPTECCGGGDSYLDLCSAILYLDKEGNSSSLTSTSLDFNKASGASTTLEAGSITLTTAAGDSMTVTGKGMYSCDGEGGTATELKLDLLKVRLIRPVDPECCEAECKPSYIDMCKSEILLKTAYHDTIKPTECCDCASDSFLDLCGTGDGGSLTLISAAGASTTVTGGFITIDAGNGGAGARTLWPGEPYGCEVTTENEHAETELSLNILKVTEITPPSCCSDNTTNNINVCIGEIYFSNTAGDSTTVSTGYMTTVGADGASTSVNAGSITLDNGNGKSKTITVDTLGTTYACEVTEENPDAETTLSVNILKVTEITPPSCCSDNTTNNINVCIGEIYFSNTAGDSTTVSTGYMTTVGADGASTSVNAGSITLDNGNGKSRTITVDDVGGGSFACVSTDEEPATTDIELSSLTVGNISGSSCCEGTSGTTLDFCGNNLTLDDGGASSVLDPSGLYVSASGESAVLASNGLTITDSGVHSYMDSSGFYVGKASMTKDAINIGSAYMEETYISIGNVTLTSDTVQVGKAYLTSANLSLNKTQVSDGNISVGDTTNIRDGKITVGAATMEDSGFSVGATSISDGNVSIGQTQISDGSVSVGDYTLTTSGLTIGETSISDGSVSVGAYTLTTSGLAIGETYVSDGNVSIGQTQISDGSVSVGDYSLSTSGLTVGETSISDGSVSIGETKISDGRVYVGGYFGGYSLSASGLTVGETSVSDGNVSIGQTQISDGSVSVGSSSFTDGTITIDGQDFTAQQITFCVDGETKTAWVLMTTPT